MLKAGLILSLLMVQSAQAKSFLCEEVIRNEPQHLPLDFEISYTNSTYSAVFASSLTLLRESHPAEQWDEQRLSLNTSKHGGMTAPRSIDSRQLVGRTISGITVANSTLRFYTGKVLRIITRPSEEPNRREFFYSAEIISWDGKLTTVSLSEVSDAFFIDRMSTASGKSVPTKQFDEWFSEDAWMTLAAFREEHAQSSDLVGRTFLAKVHIRGDLYQAWHGVIESIEPSARFSGETDHSTKVSVVFDSGFTKLVDLGDETLEIFLR